MQKADLMTEHFIPPDATIAELEQKAADAGGQRSGTASNRTAEGGNALSRMGRIPSVWAVDLLNGRERNRLLLLFFGVINIHPGGDRCKFDVCNPSPLKSSSHSSSHSKRDDPCRHRGRDNDDDQGEDVEFRFHGWRILH